ncbi:MAG: hypothetical protein MJB14_22500 [Spirochaetes bacterium]|nr:hypothetical protein [Spirochaetota bacterium]
MFQSITKAFLLTLIITISAYGDNSNDLNPATKPEQNYQADFNQLVSELQSSYQEKQYQKALEKIMLLKNLIKLELQTIDYHKVTDLNEIISNLDNNQGMAIDIHIIFIRKENHEEILVFHQPSFNMIQCFFNPQDIKMKLRINNLQYGNRGQIKGKILKSEDNKLILIIDEIKNLK